MAYTLFKTSQHSRVYEDVIDGVTTGYCKTTQIPMHYQSVHGSGDFDTVIDLAEVATDDTTIDGYTIEEIDWKFGIQTAVLAGSEPAQGTIRYRGGPGPNELLLKPVSMGYMHNPTRVYTMAGGAFDYTRSVPVWDSRTRNLATHASIADVNTTVLNKIIWDDIWDQVSEPITSVSAGVGGARFNFNALSATTKVGQVVVISGFITNTAYNGTHTITNVGNGRGYFDVSTVPFGTNEAGGSFLYREVQTNNAVKAGQLLVEFEMGYGVMRDIQTTPPAAPADTHFGQLYEIDVTDIPRVYQNGVLLDWADDFTDEDGDIVMRDGSDNLIGQFSFTTARRSWGGADRPITKRFYKVAAQNFMFVGMPYVDWVGYGIATPFGFNLKISQHPVATAHGMDAGQFHTDAGPPGPYQYETNDYPVYVSPVNFSFGSSAFYNSYQYRSGMSFRPEIPFNASMSKAGEYAEISMYERLPTYRGGSFFGGAGTIWYSDVGSSDAPLFIDGYLNYFRFYPDTSKPDHSPIPGVPEFTDSRNSSAVFMYTGVSPGDKILTPAPVGALVEEVAGLTGWQPGNNMRFRARDHENDETNYQYFNAASYSNHHQLSPVLDIVYTRNPSTRKPGVDDTLNLRNRRVSRVGGPGSNDASFRTGENNLPNDNTFDNKNRNRFS